MAGHSEHDQGSRENPMKLMHEYHRQLLISTCVTSFIMQAVLGYDGIVGYKRIFLIGIADSGAVFILRLDFFKLPDFADFQNSFRAAVVVLEHYIFLVMINGKYIEIFIIPLSILVLIGALAIQVRYQQGRYDSLKEGTESIKEQHELVNMAMVPCYFQLYFVVCTQYKGQLEDSNFIFSNFLLFIGSSLCALTVMIASPPIGDTPGAVQVLPVMQKTCIVVLLMTAHTMAAEWLWVDIVLACLPELGMVFAWLTIPGHRVIFIGTVGAIIAHFCAKDCIIVIPASSFTRVFCITSSSSAICYFNKWLLHQWPGSKPNNNGLAQLLIFSSEVCFGTSAFLAFAAYLVDWRILQEATSLFQYKTILAAALLYKPTVWMSKKILGVTLHPPPENSHQDESFMRVPLESSYEDEIFVRDSLKSYDGDENKLGGLQKSSDENDQFMGIRLESAHKDERCIEVPKKKSHKEESFRVPQETSDEDERFIGVPQESPNQEESFKGVLQENSHWEESFRAQWKRPNIQDNQKMRYSGNELQYLHKTDQSISQDRPQKEVEKILCSGSVQREVLSIVRMANSGERDHAYEAYDKIKNEFKCGATVSLDWNPNMAKLIRSIITQVGSKYEGAEGDVNELTQCLKQYLLDKRYLVNLNNLWSANDWWTVRDCFPENNLRSRILITTEFEDAVKNSDHVYWIPDPNEKEAETLFLPEIVGSVCCIFASNGKSEEACERSGLKWLEVHRMKQIIKVRCTGISALLKECLLYLSIFPENHKIDLERLVRRLIAEKFITGYLSAEGTARSYIYELIARRLIPPLQSTNDGSFGNCLVHPVIHEFIVCEAIRENFVRFAHRQQEADPLKDHRIQRLSLQNGSELDKHAILTDVSSVTIFGQGSDMPPLTEMSKLRVLDLEGCEGTLCLDGLCKLLHLRYLSLRGTDVSQLPAEIGELTNLQTLDVRSTKVEDLPPSIVRLKNLMHLLAGNAKVSLTVMRELAKIRSLRELELSCDVIAQVSGDKKQVAFLNYMFPSLKKICIWCNIPSVIFEVGALRNVEVLELKFEEELSEESTGVSGIEYLRFLRYVLVEFSKENAAARAIFAALREACALHPNCPYISACWPGEKST